MLLLLFSKLGDELDRSAVRFIYKNAERVNTSFIGFIFSFFSYFQFSFVKTMKHTTLKTF